MGSNDYASPMDFRGWYSFRETSETNSRGQRAEIHSRRPMRLPVLSMRLTAAGAAESNRHETDVTNEQFPIVREVSPTNIMFYDFVDIL